MLDIIQIDRTEMPTPLDPDRPGLLINVHLATRCSNQGEMAEHGEKLLRMEKVKKYAGITVVYWLQKGGVKERLYSLDVPKPAQK